VATIPWCAAMPRTLFLALVLALLAAGPAYAVIGGHAVRPADAPWFARVGLWAAS
jgi:hypothetical protein